MLAQVDPLDPTKFENWALHASGLMQARPPMTPAASGDSFYRIFPFQILSWYPRIVVFPGFVDKARCDHVIAMAKKALAPSGLAYRCARRVQAGTHPWPVYCLGPAARTPQPHALWMRHCRRACAPGRCTRLGGSAPVRCTRRVPTTTLPA